MAAIRRHLTLIAACIGLATAISKPFHNSSMPDLRPTFVVNFDINKVICQHSENPEDLHLHNMSVLCDGVPDCFQNPALHDENFPFCEGECTSTCNNRGACLYDGERAQCYCNAGFHGPSCEYEDVNECQEDHPCSFLAQCINTLGAYKCECLSGFKGDGYNCTDINECEEQIAACPENSNCVNLPGSHFCNCSSGFAPRGTPMEKCADIDECELGIFTCPDDKFCQNTIGNYDCVTDCSVGFELNGTVCSEVNECLNANPGPCHQKATCENTVGGYTCTCDEGFTGDGHDCSPLSDCSKDSNVCDRHGYCIAAFKTCTCKTGYSGDGFTCRDIDECANENPCKGDNGSKCVNIDGGYVCCDKDTDDEKCIEEKGAYCSGGCGQHALCLNQTCTCLEGYQGNADVRCEDINECEDEEICLGVGQWCVNFLGGHICCDANSTALECGRTGLTTLFTIESSTIVSTNEEKSEDHESFIGILESGGRWIDESGGILLIAQGQTNGSEELSSGEVIQSTAFSFKLPECEINESRNATICPENSECSEGRCICIEGYEWDGLNGGCADSTAIIATASAEIVGSNEKGLEISADMINAEETTALPTTTVEGERGTTEADAGSTGSEDQNVVSGEAGLEISGFNLGGEGASSTPSSTPELTETTTGSASSSSTNPDAGTTTASAEEPAQSSLATTTEPSKIETDDGEESSNENINELLEKGNGSTLATKSAGSSTAEPSTSTSASPDVSTQGVTSEEVEPSQATTIPSLEGSSTAASTVETLNTTAVSAITPAESTVTSEVTETSAQLPVESSTPAITTPESTVTSSTPSAESSTLAVTTVESTIASEVNATDSTSPVGSSAPESSTSGLEISATTSIPTTIVLSTQTTASSVETTASKPTNAPSEAITPTTSAPTDASSTVAASLAPEPAESTTAAPTTAEKTTSAQPASSTESSATETSTPAATGSTAESGLTPNGTETETIFVEVGATTETPITETSTVQSETGESASSGSTGTPEVVSTASVSTTPKQFTGLQIIKETGNNTTSPSRATEATAESTSVTSANMAPSETSASSASTEGASTASGATTTVSATSSETTVAGPISSTISPAALTESAIVASSATSEPEQSTTPEGSVPKSGEMGLELGPDGAKSEIATSTPGVELPDEGDNTSGEEVNKTQKLSTTTVSVHSIPTSGEQGLEIGPDEALESTTASSAPAEVTTSENASEIPTESTTVGSTTSSATTTSEPEVNVTAGLEIGPDVAATEQTPNPESTTAEQVTTGGPAEGLEISGIDLKTSTTSEPISSTTESEVVEGLEINGGMGRATTAAAETTSETTAIPTTEESSQKTTPVSTTETTAEATTETTTIVTEASTTELAAPETTASTQQQTESPTSTLTPPPTTATATGSTATTSGEVQPPSASPHPSIFIDEIENATESGITATTHCTTNDECGLNAYCERSSSTCRCSSGFRSQLLGGDCIDIDECKEKLDDCHSSSRCFNYIGGFQCLCAIGYRKNSAGICEDIDECLETNNTHCDANASCRNLPGAYLCECNKDFTGDGYTCIPEGQRHCKQTEWVKSDCGRNHLCLVDGNSTVNCDTCKRGFSMVHGVCSDINECENGVSNCHEDALCVNSMGSYSCQCQLGYAGDGYACKNIDECLQNPCHVQATCVDTLGSFVCKCPDGWTGDGVNACLNPGDLACSQRDSICGTKLDNSACLSLSFKDHFQSICECRAGFRLNVTSGICEDVDECEENRHNCDKQMSQCVNTPGGYQCQCMSGYEGSGGICVDVDECDRGIARCDVNANCINGIGGSECRCKAGFSGDGSTCVPIDERHAGISNCPDEWVDICKQSNKTCHVDDEELPQCGSCMFGFQPMDGKCQPINVAGNCVDPLKNDCDVNAECIDVRPGRHFCSCKTGYIGDGMHCDDVDECSIPRLCDTHAFCVNTNGSYECQCNDGFTGNGFKCVPANQSQNCRINPQICHTNAACQADGTCICIRGFSGDGVTSCEVLAVTEGSLYEMAFTGSSTASSILATSTSTALSSAAHNHSCSDNDRTACHVLANCDLAASECVCRQGFAGDGYLACVRIWEDCTTDPTMCHASASCDKSSKQCKCNVGYLGDGINCLPDETDCIVRSGLCSEFAQCTGRRCVCNEGYTGDGATCVPLEAPQHLAGNCSACHVHATCQVNTCQCVQGCLGNGYLCVPDPQDCVVYPGVCHMNGICNSQTRRCECKKGFLGNGLDCATRIPCSKNASICDTQAVCLPDGRCQCNRGYLGDGVECQRALSASELLSTTKPQLVLFECPESCGAHSDCINGACRCSRGYVSNDKGLCVDIDECHMNSTGCHANAQCTNTEGSYECTCRDGYSGDGRICSAVLDAPGSQSIDLVSGSIESGHSVQCKADGMLLELFEEHAPFLGRVFVRGQNSNPHCTKTFTANDTQLSFFIPIAHCDMTLEENDTLTTVVIIQKHAVFLTQDSYAYRLRCKYAQTTINVQAHADILDMVTEDTLSQNGTLSACQLRILNQENVVVDNAIVGQSLRLALSSVVSDSSPILPRSCYAINLETSQRYEITDKRGCAIDVDLFPEWDRLNATHLQATFLTFKWPDSVMIRFECDCAVCDAECPAVDCSRRREARHRQLRVARGYRFTTPPNDGEDDDSSWLKDVQMGTPSNTAFSSVVLVSDDEEEQLAQKQMEEWLENGHVNEDIFTNMDEERVCFPTQWIVICLLSIAFSLSCICAASSIYRRKTRLLPTTISE